MYKLINITNHSSDLEKFQYNHKQMYNFLKRNNFDGFEILQFDPWNNEQIPKNFIKGLHLRFYPTWIDFYRGDMDKLLSKVQFKENLVKMYGGNNKLSIITNYKEELKIAKEIGVDYVVMHVCHVDLEEVINYQFSYTNEEVINESINLINEIFDESEEYSFTLLLENLWWPGLNLKNKEDMKKLIQGINYDKVGFMLDTGHLINTNLNIKNESEAINYIMESIDNLEEMKKYIFGIHLNYSLSGKYVKEFIEKQSYEKRKYEFNELLENIYTHVGKIDCHDPFEHHCINDLINLLDIKYLVYEFFASNLVELEKKVKIQDSWIIKSKQCLE